MKKKICVVGPCLNMGGIERASSTIANSFAEKGHDVLYLAIFKHPRFFKLRPEIVFDEPLDGTNVTSLNIIKTISRIRRVVRNYNPDSIIAFNKLYAALTLIATIGLRKKVFISERSSPFYKWPQRMEIINKLAFWMHPPRGIVAQTNIAAEYQAKKVSAKTKIKVIPNALRPVSLYPEINHENWILAVGRLDDHLKGFDLLVEAYAKCKSHNWKLVFAGGDENGAVLKQKGAELGILHNIIFLGKIENIDAIYAQASIFVIPSRSEGFPNALCEAMAAGLACVSFDFVAGPRDIISDGKDGIIVEFGNTDALAATIDNLVENSLLRATLGANAMHIAERLNSEKIGNEYLNFILS